MNFKTLIKPSKITSFLAIFLLSLTFQVQSKEVLGAFQPAKPPFIIPEAPYDDFELGKTSKGLGIQVDIARAALKVKGHTLKHVFVSEKRLNEELKLGRLDIAFDVRPEYQQRFYSKHNFSHYENALITRKNYPNSIKSFDDLTSVSMVTWQGATKDLGSKFANAVANNPGYVEMPDTRKLKLFLEGRVEGLLIDKDIFKWYYKEVYKGTDFDGFTYHSLKELSPRGGKSGFVSESLRNDFDIGMETIRQNGTYQKIVDSYLR